MQDWALKFYVRMLGWKDGLADEDGQDMVEYAIVVGLIAMGATVAMKGLATSISTGFTSLGTKMTTYTS